MAGQGGLAREIRAGLEVINGGAQKAQTVNKLDEIRFKKSVRVHVREFAAIFSIIFLLIAGVKLYNGQPIDVPIGLLVASGLLLLVGYKLPAVLLPVYESWMKLAHVLGIVMTGLILFVTWSIMLVPISLLLRTLRIKVMNSSFRAPVDSYWESRDSKYNDFKLLERQF